MLPRTKRRLIRAAILARCWWLGFREFRRSCGRMWGSPLSRRSSRYDEGRDMAHRLTFRVHDKC